MIKASHNKKANLLIILKIQTDQSKQSNLTKVAKISI